MPAVPVKLVPFSKKQLQVLCWWCPSSPQKERSGIICDGAVRSGKTLCMGISFVCWAFSRFSQGSFALCGKTIGSVKRNLVTEMLPVLQELGFVCRLRLAENVLEIYNGRQFNRFYLFGGRDEGAQAMIQGLTLSGILLDEVVLMPRSFVQQALARCSAEGATFWFNCNPSHPGHWFYREWICCARQKDVVYLHFTMEDNPSLSEKTKQRYRSLFSGAFYQRFVLGKWVAAQGLVYPFMQENFCKVPAQCTRYFLSCDYGTVNPCSVGLWGLWSGVWYRVDEYYFDSRTAGAQRTDEEHLQAVRQLCAARKNQGVKIEGMVVDPSAASFITLLRKSTAFPVLPAQNDVLDGIRRVSCALKEGRVRICDSCRDAVREFGLYRWNDDLSRDAPVKENDHAMDDIRYFVSAMEKAAPQSSAAFAVAREEIQEGEENWDC